MDRARCHSSAGLAIGAGAEVGAGAVLSKNVAPYEIVGGVPARHIEWRFASHQADGLQAIAWWDWNHARQQAPLHDIRTLAIDAFIEKH